MSKKKRRTYMLLALGFAVLLLITGSMATMPPVSREYAKAVKAAALARQRGEDVETDFDAIPKFERGWQYKDPLFYIQHFNLAAVLTFLILALREGRKTKREEREATSGNGL